MARSRRPKTPRKQARQPDRWGASLNEAARARGFTGLLFTVADSRPVGKLPLPGFPVAEEGDMVKVLTRGTFGRDGTVTGETSLFRAAGLIRAFHPVRLVPTRDSLATVTARREGSPVGVALPPVLQIDANMRPLARRPGFWEANEEKAAGRTLEPDAAPAPAAGRDHGFYTAIAGFLFDVDLDVVAPSQEARAVRLCEELAAGEDVESLRSRTAAIPLRRILALDALLAQPCVRTPGDEATERELFLNQPLQRPAQVLEPLAAAMIAAGKAPGDPMPAPYPPPLPAPPAIGETATKLVDEWVASVMPGTKVPYDAQTALICRITTALRAERDR